MVSNTDDHLRNHGFILTHKGLRLSPAYDINPNPNGYGLHLNIDEQDNSLDTEVARSAAPYFRLSDSRALQIIQSIKEKVSSWEDIADNLKINGHEKSTMRPAFNVE